MHTHMSMPLQFVSDIAFRKSFDELGQEGFTFPLTRLCELVKSEKWTDFWSQMKWKEYLPDLDYQLWTSDPLHGGQLRLQGPQLLFCDHCNAGLVYPLEVYLAVSLDGTAIRCQSCRQPLDIGTNGRSALAHDLDLFVCGRSSIYSKLFPLDPKTGAPHINAVSSDLNRIELEKSPLWMKLTSKNPQTWKDIVAAARRTQSLEHASKLPLNNPYVLEQICERYQCWNAYEFSLDFRFHMTAFCRTIQASISHYSLERSDKLLKEVLPNYKPWICSRVLDPNSESEASQDIHIALCWWTHVLSPHNYYQWCLTHLGKIVRLDLHELFAYTKIVDVPDWRRQDMSALADSIGNLRVYNQHKMISISECEVVLDNLKRSESEYDLMACIALKKLKDRALYSCRP